jgi:acetyl-CoA C-acetyltransferase
MRDVYLIGIGQTKVTKKADIRGRYMAAEVIGKAIEHAGIERKQVGMLIAGNMTAGRLTHQQQLGALYADIAGLRGVEAVSCEAACGSGATAARWGVMSVGGGFHDVAVVCGLERMTHAPLEDVTAALATAADWELEGINGESFISLNAKLMMRYMETYGVTAKDFGHFAITAHDNGLTNPMGFLHKKIDMECYLNSRMLVDPVKLLDAPPVCDGAAAIILATEEVARAAHRNGLPMIKVAGSAIGTDSLALDARRDMLELDGVAISTRRALAQAGLKNEDIDIFELHDAYTIITTLSLEAAGFAEKGKGVHFGKEGEITRTGKLPISTFGGLKSRGHPVGATGVYQLVETYMQLTGTAGENQVPDPEFALVQNVGGTAATVVSHILQRCA